MKSKVRNKPDRGDGGKFTTSRGASATITSEDIDVQELVSFLTGETQTVRPIVRSLPPNFRLVICDVGPHRNVRVMVRPNNQNYIPRMVIPLDVDLTDFDPKKLLVYNGNPPRRKGMW
jgi:hypothetical protein